MTKIFSGNMTNVVEILLLFSQRNYIMTDAIVSFPRHFAFEIKSSHINEKQRCK